MSCNAQMRGSELHSLVKVVLRTREAACVGRSCVRRTRLGSEWSLLPRVWAVAFLLLCLAFPLSAAPLPNVTSYTQMTARIKADAARSPLVRVTSLGKSARGGRALWLVRLSDPAADPARTPRLLVLCRQHGDEPASTEAVVGLIHRVASQGDPALRTDLAHVTLYFVPMVNPDGAEAGTRRSGAGADLNRDWGLFHQPETRAVAVAARLIQPALVVDAHNWDGSDEYNADCVEVPRDMQSASGKAAHAMQRQLIEDLAASGYAVHPTAWGAEANPHLAHRWFARKVPLSLLVETHYGPASDRADFARRQGMYAALVRSLARHYAAPWMNPSPAATREAKLFPALPETPTRAARGRAAPERWLWALGLYGLALWGLSLRRPTGASPKTRADLGRYSLTRKRSRA